MEKVTHVKQHLRPGQDAAKKIQKKGDQTVNTRRMAVLTVLIFSLFLTAWYTRAADDPPAKHASKASLGVFVEPTPPNAEHPGVIIQQAPPDSPAAKGGMKAGDIIVKAGDRDVKDFDALANALANHKPGDKVAFHVLRDGQDKSLTVTLGESAIRTAARDDLYLPARVRRRRCHSG